MAKKEMSIEDLPGVGAATADKLREAGYNSLMAIAVASPGELVESAGVGEAVARKMINIARNNLDMGFVSGDDLLKKRETIIKISTGSKAFDAIVNGGFESGGITECYGQFGSGKSALAHQLAINGLCVNEDGEPTASVVWIDSENTFRPERIKEICENNNMDPIKILKSIKVVRAFNSDHQMMCAEKIEDLMEKEGLTVKLVIVDSLMTHFRSEFCITEDMEVIGNPKVKKITEYKENDKVLTHKGRFAKVINTRVEDYDGEMVKINPCYGTEVKLTPDHSVLALKSIRTSWYKNKSKYSFRDPNNYTKIIEGKNFYKLYEGYGPDWIMAGTLEKGDYLAYPIIKEVKDVESIMITDYIDATKYSIIGNKIKSTDIYHDKEIYEKILKEYKINPAKGEMVKLSKKYKLPMSTISQWINGKQNTRKLLDLDIKIPITEESMRLFGYYLAEGHNNDHQVVFTFHKKEQDYINDVKNLMKKVFGIEANKSNIKDNTYRIVFSNKVLAEFFASLLGKRAPNKHMPKWVLFLPENKQKEIIVGHWRGDGTTSKDGYRFDTTSRLLAEQIKQILLRLKILSTFRIDNCGRDIPKYIIEVFGKQIDKMGIILGEKEHEVIKKRSNTYNHGWIDDNYAFYPIRAINKEMFSGKIYNLEIEEDSSFALNSAVVHNCGRGTLADRQQKINKHMHTLMKLADQHNLVVYVTNQVMSKPDTFFGDPTAAIGGNIVGHNSCTRLYLRRGKADTRVAKLVDSPYLPDAEAIFKISEKGIIDAK